MGESMCRVTIGGQEEHALGEIVEAADVSQARHRWNDVEHGPAA